MNQINVENHHVEIELKFSIKNLSLLDFWKKLEQLWFTNKWKKYEKTSMYDNRDFLMQKTNGRIRLRISWEKYELSYKKPIVDDSWIKKEIEYNCDIANPDTLSKILNTMDYYEVSSYERYRTTYMDSWELIQVTIDEFPFDIFLEIEWDEQRIIQLADDLWFSIKDNLTKPCDTLFNDRRKSQWLAEKMIMTFDDYDQP
jgi:predicted adenylyl cyclase CyaB